MSSPVLIIENELITDSQRSLLKEMLVGQVSFFCSWSEVTVLLQENLFSVVIVLEEYVAAAELRLAGLPLPIIVFSFEPELTFKKALDVFQAREKHDLLFAFSEEQLVEKLHEFWPEKEVLYFIGSSEKIKFFNRELQKMTMSDRDLFIYAEPGCGKKEVASFLHKALGGDGYFRELNLLNFIGDNYETHIWAALNDIYKLNSNKRFSCKTLYIKGLESKDVLFIISVLEWFCEKKRLLKEQLIITPRVIFSFSSAALFESLMNDFKDKYLFLMIPALRERREDLSLLIDYFVSDFNKIYNKKVQTLSINLLNFLFRYEWPGNIDELMYNLEPLFIFAAVDEQLIDLKNLFLPRRLLAETGLLLDKF